MYTTNTLIIGNQILGIPEVWSISTSELGQRGSNSQI